MSLVTLTSWISSKYSCSDRTRRVAQQRTDETLLQRLERDNVLAVGENHAADRDLVQLPDGLPDHREGVVTDLAVGTQVVRTDQIARVDVGRVDELVDLDGPRRLQRQLLELLLGDLDVLSFVEFVALDDVFVRHLVTGIGVDLHVLDPVTGRSIELIERDLFGFRCRRVESHRTGDERQTQEAFPVGSRGHGTQNSSSGRLDLLRLSSSHLTLLELRP